MGVRWDGLVAKANQCTTRRTRKPTLGPHTPEEASSTYGLVVA